MLSRVILSIVFSSKCRLGILQLSGVEISMLLQIIKMET